MSKRLRLIDAVAVAAVAMLALKGLDYLRHEAPRPASPLPQASVLASDDDLPSFGRALSYARSEFLPPEILTTGSTDDASPSAENAPAAGGAAASPPADALAARADSQSPAERAILDRLEERRRNLQQRDQDIELRERLLEQAEQRLEERLREARGQAADAQPDGQDDEERKAGMRNLVAMYQAMRPKDAARVFDRLSLDILVPVVLEINPRTMAEIMAAMSPEAAERLTVALALRAQGQAAPSRAAGVMGGAAGNELPALELPQRR